MNAIYQLALWCFHLSPVRYKGRLRYHLGLLAFCVIVGYEPHTDGVCIFDTFDTEISINFH